MAGVARVLVDAALPQLDRLLDYRIPDSLEGVEPGIRVSVPLRSAKRMATAFVIETAADADFPGPLSEVSAVVSTIPVLRPEVWRLARAVADRAAGSANDVLRLAVPPRQVRVEKAWLARVPSERSTVVAPSLDGYAGLAEALDAGERVALRVQPGVTESAGVAVSRWALVLAQAAAHTLAAGRSSILVAPDHRDQDQLERALTGLVPADALLRWDSRQPNADRYRALLVAGDRPSVIVGNRSAVYAPAESLGLLAIWNDGDPLLGEPLTPYVHARDAALVRHEQQGGALVLAGHTRSTETQRLVEIGWLRELGPAKRIRLRIIPTADGPGDEAIMAQARIPSVAWREARAGLDRGPVLVQVARPGYAPGLRCAECGEAARCRRCSGPLRQRSAGAVPTCTWCGTPDRSWSCPNCQSRNFRTSGAGSARTADELGRAFPGTRVIVSDGERPILEVDDRPALVIATRGAEPFAPHGYRAVLLLDGERMLARESLRVAEDCLRWWSDAAALAADDAGVVLVGVGGALGHALAGWDQPDFARTEYAGRRELRFPPAVRMATLQGNPDAVEEALAQLPASAEVLGTTLAAGRARAILRFDYRDGTEIAESVHAEVIRQATRRRKPIPGTPPRGRQPLPLRARFDDPEPFEE
ncbi:MAG: primosomal protein N' [Pseudolysinimonas sp.]|uniref:primosomal protein N' family DNA-binding protein n=1 Tax=Pseudolysinimonas sp. TaxID=2680009 RepID=UPI003C76F622